MTPAPRLHVLAIELFERPVKLRIPFRFGLATVTHAPQAFVRARIALENSGDGRDAQGASAELMIPKWFDKAAHKSNEDNIEDLRLSLEHAANAYTTDGRARTAFGHFAAHYADLMSVGERAGLNALTASYGAALVDRAVLDALCRALGIAFHAAVRDNVPGIDARLSPDLGSFDLGGFLRGLSPLRSVAARHTVGMVDALTSDDDSAHPADDLPATLDQVIAVYGNRYFKLKLGGDVDADVKRLVRIARILHRLPAYVVTLDGNEQYADAARIEALWRAIAATPALTRLSAATMYLEQPLARAIALSNDVTSVARHKPLLIDESDATLDAFPAARELGYTGVSSKSCKGIYKSIINAARCAAWNAHEGSPRFFLSAEDLTTQAGLAVQQDLALVATLGLTHVERNGHHYVNGFRGQGAGADETLDFLLAQPDLYDARGDNVYLAVRGGMIDLSSFDAPGFASGAMPDWPNLSSLQTGANAGLAAAADPRSA
jgi:hypothetical protein